MAIVERPKRGQFRTIADFNQASYAFKIGQDYTRYLASTKDASDAANKDADGKIINGAVGANNDGMGGDGEELINPEYTMANHWFQGNTAIIDFTDDLAGGKLYLFDKDAGTFRGFESAQAMANYFDIPLEEVSSYIYSVPSNVLSSPDFKGQLLSWKNDIKEDGTSVEEPVGTEAPGSSAGLQSLYGQEQLPASVEEAAGSIIGAVFTTLLGSGAITQDTWNNTVSNPDNLAKYVNAFVYGQYNMQDIYREIKGNELGISEKGFDENMLATEWYKTPEGQKSQSNTATTPPTDLGNMDPDLFKYSIFKIPGKAFSTIIPPVDPNSPEFKAEAEEIQASYYDIMMQNSEATTEQEKALALDNWNTFKDTLEKNYGIRLSDNARVAWGQIGEITSGHSQRGIGQSGLMEEALDKQLIDTRRSDDILREAKLDEKELQQRNYLKSSGTPEEIAAFVASDPTKASEWGLIPSQEISNWYSASNLKSLYPDMSDDEIGVIHDMMLDESGNYRSGLYQNMYANKYDLGEQKKAYQQQKLYDKKLVEEEKAYAPWTQANPFTSYLPDYAKPDQATKDFVDKLPGDTTSETPPSANQSSPLKYNDQGQVWDAMNKKYVASYTPPTPTPTPTPTTPTTAPVSGFKTRGEQSAYEKARIAANKIQTQAPATPTDTAWSSWTSKNKDVLGKNWQGYAKIGGADYDTPEKRKAYQNVQSVGPSLYGYKQ